MRVGPISSMPRDLASTLTCGVLLSDHYGERRAMADVTTFLDEAGLDFEVLEHAHTERAADEAAAFGVSSAEVAKTLVLPPRRAMCAPCCRPRSGSTSPRSASS